MTDIYLRSANANSSLGESTLNRPLTNSEIDLNFKHLNESKADLNGALAFDKLIFTEQQNTSITDAKAIYYSDNENAFFIKGNLFVNGNINQTGSIETIDTGASSTKLFTLDELDSNNISTITNASLANGGGIRIAAQGYAQFIYEYNANPALSKWKAIDNSSSLIDINAKDFIGSNNQSLSNAYTQIGVINAQLGTNSIPGGATNNYSSNKTILDNTSLKAAIEALDAEDIPSIQTFIGQSAAGATTSYSAPNASNVGVGIVNTDSLITAIDKLNKAMLYTIHTVESISAPISIVSGRLYLVNPSGPSVSVNLPIVNKGIVAFRLEDDTGGKKITVSGGSDTIEGLATPIDINIKYQTVQFIWDDNGNTWRVL